MSIRILYIFLFLIISSHLANGQNIVTSTTVAIRASATVTDNLKMLTIRNLDLINPVVIDNKVVVSPTSSPFAGLFKVLGNPESRIRITFLQREILKEQNDGIGEVLAQYYISAAEEDFQFQSRLLDVGEGNVKLSENGQLFLWLGANLDLEHATPGLYLSEFTVELEYL